MLKTMCFRCLRAVLCLAAAWGTLWTTSSARADRLAVIVRGSGAGADKAAGFVSVFAEEAFAKDDRYTVVTLPKTLGSPGADRAERAFGVALEMLGKGKTAYEELDLDAAIDDLNNALAKFERHAAYVGDTKPVLTSLMLLGATHILRGEERAGEKRLSHALAIDPTIEPDPRVFNPTMRDVFQRVYEHLRERPPGTLSVSSNPSYARVYVDGRFVGVAPVALDGLAEGRHFVRLVKDGYRPWGRLIDVVGGRRRSETATLKPATHFDDFDTLVDGALVAMGKEDPKADPAQRAPVSEAVDQLGVLLNADSVFLVGVRLEDDRVKLVASHYDLNAGQRIKTVVHNFAHDQRLETYRAEVAGLVERHFPQKTLVTNAEEPLAGDVGLAHAVSGGLCGGMTCHKKKVAVLLSGLGAGVAFMGVGAGLWGAANGKNNSFRGSVQNSSQASSLADSGRVLAAMGDVFFFAGAAGAVASTVLYLVWEPSPSTKAIVDGGSPEVGVAPLPGGLGFNTRLRF